MNLKKLEAFKELECLVIVTITNDELLTITTSEISHLIVDSHLMGYKTIFTVDRESADYAIDNSISTISVMSESKLNALSQDILDRINILKYSKLKD